MTRKLNVLSIIGIIAFPILFLMGCSGAKEYRETFDKQGKWSMGTELNRSGQVVDGVYRFTAGSQTGLSWATAALSFDDGVYSVDVRQSVGQPNETGYGLIFRVDEKNSFYLFQISADGYVWIGRCMDGFCDGSNQQILVENGWFQSSAVRQGVGNWNTLTVNADHGNLIFAINETEVGRVSDYILTKGDVGLLVENYGSDQVEVEFDNLNVLPLK